MAMGGLRTRRTASMAGTGSWIQLPLPSHHWRHFEFGFSDAILQMWAAFIDEVMGGDAYGFHCSTPAEAAEHHAVLTAALQAGKTAQSVNVNYNR